MHPNSSPRLSVVSKLKLLVLLDAFWDRPSRRVWAMGRSKVPSWYDFVTRVAIAAGNKIAIRGKIVHFAFASVHICRSVHRPLELSQGMQGTDVNLPTGGRAIGSPAAASDNLHDHLFNHRAILISTERASFRDVRS